MLGERANSPRPRALFGPRGHMKSQRVSVNKISTVGYLGLQGKSEWGGALLGLPLACTNGSKRARFREYWHVGGCAKKLRKPESARFTPQPHSDRTRCCGRLGTGSMAQRQVCLTWPRLQTRRQWIKVPSENNDSQRSSLVQRKIPAWLSSPNVCVGTISKISPQTSEQVSSGASLGSKVRGCRRPQTAYRAPALSA